METQSNQSEQQLSTQTSTDENALQLIVRIPHRSDVEILSKPAPTKPLSCDAALGEDSTQESSPINTLKPSTTLKCNQDVPTSVREKRLDKPRLLRLLARTIRILCACCNKVKFDSQMHKELSELLSTAVQTFNVVLENKIVACRQNELQIFCEFKKWGATSLVDGVNEVNEVEKQKIIRALKRLVIDLRDCINQVQFGTKMYIDLTKLLSMSQEKLTSMYTLPFMRFVFGELRLQHPTNMQYSYLADNLLS